MTENNKPLTDPSEQNVSSEEGKDVASKEVETTSGVEDQKDLSVEKEVNDALAKLEGRDETREKQQEEQKKEEINEETKKIEGLEKLSLDEINKITKREFKSKEDFVKHYESLASFSGSDQAQELRKKAEGYDQMLKDAEEIEKLLANKDKTEERKPVIKEKDRKFVDLESRVISTNEKADNATAEINKLKEQLADTEFVEQHPEAKSYLNIIKTIANKEEKTLNEVYEGSDLETLIADSKAFQEAKEEEKNLGVSSKNRLAPTVSQKKADLLRKIKLAERGQSTSRDLGDLKQKLVEEVLDMKL